MRLYFDNASNVYAYNILNFFVFFFSEKWERSIFSLLNKEHVCLVGDIYNPDRILRNKAISFPLSLL